MCAGESSDRRGPQNFSGGTLGVTNHLVAVGLQGYVVGLWLGMPGPGRVYMSTGGNG